MALGIFSLIKNRRIRKFGIFLIFTYLLLGPFYFYYASYLVNSDFAVGLMERFLIPSYIIAVLIIGCGLGELLLLLSKIAPRLGVNRLKNIMTSAVVLMLFIFVSYRLYQTIVLFLPLREDRTADNLGMDILNSASASGILVLYKDAEIFPAQYMRYTRNVRPDTTVLFISRLIDKNYRQKALRYHDIADVSTQDTDESNIIIDFIKANYNRPMYFNDNYVIPGYLLIPEGFVYRIYEEKLKPDPKDIIALNKKLWSGFHDPSKGLSRIYAHPLYTNFESVYAERLAVSGIYALNNQEFSDAIWFFEKAVKFRSNGTDGIYRNLGIAFLALQNCEQAGIALTKAKEYALSDTLKTATAWYAYASQCNLGDQIVKKAEADYLKIKQMTETPLAN
jgi:hypothetical protein